jgi:SAM-dependent methyltransferase
MGMNPMIEKLAYSEIPDEGVRSLSVEEARSLRAGDAHYRAYVGPPDRYDFIGGSQFALLFALGMRDHHSVLDFGCGSLRLGRLLMPFLQSGKYFGIDPNRWLIEDGLAREIGTSIVSVKRPSFAYNDDFACDVFSRRFDFVVAQSIFTHCGKSLARSLLDRFARVLEPEGIALFSVLEALPAEPDAEEDGWVYPTNVAYRQQSIIEWCAQAGMVGVRLPWFHPRLNWYAAAIDAGRLPTAVQMRALSGAVLFDRQFEASWPTVEAGAQTA